MGRRAAEGGSGRRARARVAAPATIVGTSLRKIPVYDLVGDERLDQIHDASMRILEDVGIEFRDETALATWREAGAEVSKSRVRVPRQLVEEGLAKAPPRYTFHARNPKRSVEVGGHAMAFAPVYGSPYVRDRSGQRRYAQLDDFIDFVKLAYASPALNVSGGTICEPVDIPVAHRHLEMIYAHVRYSDKPFMGGVTSADRARDCLALCRILHGEEFLEHNTVLTSLINCNSPLVWDETMLSVLRVYASAKQACIISPFIMQGANTPITTVGAFAQLNAEALAGICYAQLVQPGAPVVYGATLSTVSMKTGAPMYGTSETQHLMFLTGQMARRYNLPMRTGGLRTGSKSTDSLSAYESVQTMLPAILSGGHYFLHSAGWLESGLSACFAKFLLDADQLTILQRMAEGLSISADDFAFDAIEEVGPGGHFLGCSHTLQRYASAFYVPQTADSGTFEQWFEEGSRDSLARASELVEKTLEDYVAPPLDEGIDESLRAFIERRKETLPVGVE